MERVESLVDERQRVVAGLAESWMERSRRPRPTSSGCPWGRMRRSLREFAAGQALSVRGFAGEGVRVTVGESRGQHPVPGICAGTFKGSALSWANRQ